MSDDLISLPVVALISPAKAGQLGDQCRSYTTQWDTIIATRYDKLARNFVSAVALATLIAFWV